MLLLSLVDLVAGRAFSKGASQGHFEYSLKLSLHDFLMAKVLDKLNDYQKDSNCAALKSFPMIQLCRSLDTEKLAASGARMEIPSDEHLDFISPLVSIRATQEFETCSPGFCTLLLRSFTLRHGDG